MTSAPNAPGFYGKVPILADFVSRRLPTRFVQPWDNWLQGALSASKEQLGSDWLDIYLTSPIWRFVLSPGNCGTEAWAGVLMPSVDKVGRYFPLTLAVSISDRNLLYDLLATATDWFNKLEQLALSALEDDFKIDEFDQTVQEQVLRVPVRENAIHRVGNGLTKNNSNIVFRFELAGLEQISDAFIQMNDCLLDKFLTVYSVWSTNGSEQMKPSLLLFGGLPSIGAYAELLSGQWQQDGWRIQPNVSSSLPEPDVQSPAGAHAAGTRQRDADDIDAALQWRSSAISTVGKRRKINEDAYLERPDIGLWAVADGMGGHRAGDVASNAVIHALGTVPGSESLSTLTASVTSCMQHVNARLLAMADNGEPDQIIGSTVVAMLAVGNRCAAVWAGDSRLYRYRNGVLTQLTHDHSLVAEMSRQGTLTSDTGVDNPDDNIVTRALGVEQDMPFETIAYEAKAGDIYMLCSDGLVKEVDHDEFVDILKQGECDKASQDLIDLALARGARDNVTVIVVHTDRSLLS